MNVEEELINKIMMRVQKCVSVLNDIFIFFINYVKNLVALAMRGSMSKK